MILESRPSSITPYWAALDPEHAQRIREDSVLIYAWGSMSAYLAREQEIEDGTDDECYCTDLDEECDCVSV